MAPEGKMTRSEFENGHNDRDCPVRNFLRDNPGHAYTLTEIIKDTKISVENALQATSWLLSYRLIEVKNIENDYYYMWVK